MQYLHVRSKSLMILITYNYASSSVESINMHLNFRVLNGKVKFAKLIILIAMSYIIMLVPYPICCDNYN